MLAAGLAAAGPAAGLTPQAAQTKGVAGLLAQFLLPAGTEYSAADWSQIRDIRAGGLQWGKGPVMLNRATPEGDFFAMPGRALVDGRPVLLAANGARTMVFNLYLIDPAPEADPEAVPDGFRAAGYTVTPARCPRAGHYPDRRRWYGLGLKGKREAFVQVAPTKNGGTGYILYQGGLPRMSEKDAALFTDDCAGAGGAAGGTAATAAKPAGFGTGSGAVISLIDRLTRPQAAPSGLGWPVLTILPGITWRPLQPRQMAIPLPIGGADENAYLLSGTLDTATTSAEAYATGDARAATRFYFQRLTHVPPGAVFAELEAKGYTIAPLRCGKRYIKSSGNWFRLSAPGKRPAVLFRTIFDDDGLVETGYALRIDNVMPPMEPGQYAPPPGGCPEVK